MSDVAHYTTKKVGDAKGRKKQLAKPQRAETKPAPHGQRITPVIDPAFVKKVNEEIVKRNRVRRIRFDLLSSPCNPLCRRRRKSSSTNERSSSTSFARESRRKNSPRSCKCAVNRRRRFSTPQVSSRCSFSANCSPFHRLFAEKKASEAAKEKKLDSTVDSNASIISLDGQDQCENVKDDLSPKQYSKRPAKAKAIKYGNSDDDEENNQENLDDDESDYQGSDSDTEKKVKKAKTKPRPQVTDLLAHRDENQQSCVLS